VFIAGLMVGRTPKHSGRKSGVDVQMAMLVVLVFPRRFLFTAISVISPSFGVQHPQSGTARPFEILYAFVSGTGSNGSAFGGLSANALFYASRSGWRCWSALLHDHPDAGDCKRPRAETDPPSPGTFPVTTPLFSALLVGVIVIVGALTFFPRSAWVRSSSTC
jgi:K+-transporting ATPase ATPase A chain